MEDGLQEDIVRLLPDSVANQIAAGEVIQRPASVIKELVENSIDAGATSVEIVVKDAGKTLIQVIDDGKGMSTTDARMALERHATSKIRCADDLFSLHTMGFRGEALPSIAAVSEMEIITRRECDELGTKIELRASHVDSQEPSVALKGTNIKVKNLFYNFVARRRFLKKDSIELTHIVHEFERLALVNTDVSFRFTSNGVTLHSLQKGPLKNRISSLFGKSLGDNLIPVNVETSLVKIEGFISVPAAARQRGQRQFLFVNGRNMRHPYFHRAILSCYEQLIAKDVQPHYFINFTVAPDRIDVNIHPQKHEIKFEDEQSIWQILTAAVREALGRHSGSAAIDFNSFGAPEIPPLVNGGGTQISDLNELTTDEIGDYNPFELRKENPENTRQTKIDFGSYDGPGRTVASRPSSLNSYRSQGSTSEHVKGWEQFYQALEKNRAEKQELPESETTQPDVHFGLDDGELAEGITLFQVRNKYIVTEMSGGVMLIDQYRAHVNILFNMFREEVRNGEVSSQQLMFSEPLDLDGREQIMLDSSIELMERIGFRFGKEADGSYSLVGIPGTLGAKNPVGILRNILSDLAESGIDVEADALSRVLLTMARGAAITGGRQLTQSEMQHIVSSLFRLPAPGYTPDGHKIIYRLTDERLASFFG